MKRFNGSRPCVKCGSMSATSKFQSAFLGFPETIRRTCVRCEYVWTEVPLDARSEVTVSGTVIDREEG